MKKLSPHAIIALKDALSVIYWKKGDIRRFCELTMKNNGIIATIDWVNPTKSQSVSELIDRICNRQDLFGEDLMLLFKETANMTDFSQFNNYNDEDGSKAKAAKAAVAKLRNFTQGYFDKIDEIKKTEEKKVEHAKKIIENTTFRSKLDELKNRFLGMYSSTPQTRGYELEKLLYDTFLLFDMNPKASFKIVSEQIDGAFTHENHDYLLEAKWQQELITAKNLGEFAGVVLGKHKLALGLYFSLNGFSPEALNSRNPSLNSLILMDGQELMYILEGRVALDELISKKKRHSTETGNIFYKVDSF